MSDTMDRFAGGYGPRWAEGILSENTERALDAGLTFFAMPNGAMYLADEDGECVPIVCSEIVQIATEDGPISGRCGALTIRNESSGEWLWCEGHDMADWARECSHGLSLALCAGPGHYPMDY